MDGWREGGAGLNLGGSESDFSRITYNEFLFTSRRWRVQSLVQQPTSPPMGLSCISRRRGYCRQVRGDGT